MLSNQSVHTFTDAGSITFDHILMTFDHISDRNVRKRFLTLDWVAAATVLVLAIHVVVRLLLRLRSAIVVLLVRDAWRR
jgi:hypothetical protein